MPRFSISNTLRAGDRRLKGKTLAVRAPRELDQAIERNGEAREMTTVLRAALVLMALAWTARPEASDIDRVAHDCGTGKADACAQLSAKARASHDGSMRRAAAQRLIQARLRYCVSTAGEHSLWHAGQRVRLDTEYLFEHELEASRQAEIERAGDQFVADALRSAGLEVGRDSKPGDAVVELTLLGAARAWLFGTTEFGGSLGDIDNSVGTVLYPDATWEGVVTVRDCLEITLPDIRISGDEFRSSILHGTDLCGD